MFGERIEKIRTAYNWTQVQLARKLNVSKQTVSNWENNNILPSIEMLIRLSDIFSVSTDYLLSLDDREFVEVTGLTELQDAHRKKVPFVINRFIFWNARNIIMNIYVHSDIEQKRQHIIHCINIRSTPAH